MARLILTILIIACTACSTVKTVSPSDGHIYISTWGYKSNCKKIPRIYSGISYDFCLLNSKSRSNNSGFDGFASIYVFTDFAWSIMADTVVLPYTIYTQISDGNIKLN